MKIWFKFYNARQQIANSRKFQNFELIQQPNSS